jgi:hypothetical protein
MMDATMYCHACGGRIPAGSAYCSHCGAAQGHLPRDRSGTNSALVILALIFFFPLGLVLMWTSTDWNTDLKWAISALFFPPLWLRFLWKVPWLPYAVGALLAALTIQGAVFGGISVVGAIAILTVITVILLFTLGMQRPRKRAGADMNEEQYRAVEEKLDACDDLIADIEADLSLELLPIGSPERQRYVRALEMRSEGRELFQRAATPRELVAAEGRVTGALRELRALRNGIAGESDAGTGGRRGG